MKGFGKISGRPSSFARSTMRCGAVEALASSARCRSARGSAPAFAAGTSLRPRSVAVAVHGYMLRFLFAPRGALLLQLPHLREEAARADQLRMGTALDDSPMVHHDD